MGINSYSRTNEELNYIAVNRVPLGYAYFPTTRADNINTGEYGNGASLELTQASDQADFQLLNPWYIVGARGVFENCTKDDRLNAWFIAPPTTSLTQTPGNCIKYNIGIGNMIIPSPSGDWTVDLSAKFTGTNILKSTPVRAIDNNGWYDFDYKTNELTENTSQKGEYNLYDFEIKLFKFANELFGRSQNGSSADYIIDDVVGKLIFNFYKFRFKLTTTSAQSWIGIELHTFVSRNT